MTEIAVGHALLGDRIAGPTLVVVDDDGLIADIQPGSGSPGDGLLAPGFIDLQVNGHDDIDVATAEGADWDRLDGLLLAQGVTTWCPTLVTAPRARMEEAIGRVIEASARPPAGRPDIAGLHLEGPFLGGAPGAHRREWLVPIDADWLASLPPLVRLVTLGPELDGAAAATASLSARGVVVSLGHSMASVEQASACIDAGARLVTHLFNGMSPFHHRDPGLVGVALADPRVAVSLIADGIHVHPIAIRAAFNAKGVGGVALVTDAIAWRQGEGHAGFAVELRDGAPRLPDGTLAGSALTMDRAVANAVASGIDVVPVLAAASSSPGAVLGLADRGRIEIGRRADLVLLSPAFGVEGVWVGGVRVR